jgi:hypothetical protein
MSEPAEEKKKEDWRAPVDHPRNLADLVEPMVLVGVVLAIAASALLAFC